jgi:hypothetical protein
MALHTAGSTLAGLVVLEAESETQLGPWRALLDGKGDDAHTPEGRCTGGRGSEPSESEASA